MKARKKKRKEELDGYLLASTTVQDFRFARLYEETFPSVGLSFSLFLFLSLSLRISKKREKENCLPLDKISRLI